MSENLLRDRLGVIDKLKYLSECVDKKCVYLSAASDSAKTEEQLLQLCVNIRKNCEIFEEMLLREETCIDSSKKESNLVVTLHLLDIIGEENCRKLKNDQINKFKADLEIFTKNYLLQTTVSENEILDLLAPTEEVSEKYSSPDKKDPSKEIHTQENLQGSSNSLNEVNRNKELSSKIVENELLSPSNEAVEIAETRKDEDVAGPPNQTDKPQNSKPTSSCNEIIEDGETSTANLENQLNLSAERPAEIEDANINETSAECDEEKLKVDDVEDQSSEKTPSDSPQITFERKADSEENNSESSDNDRVRECSASDVNSSEVVENNVDKEDKTVSSVNLEIVNSSKAGLRSTTNSPEDTEESVVKKPDIVNSSTEIQNSKDTHETTDSTADSSKLVDEKLESGVINHIESSDDSQNLVITSPGVTSGSSEFNIEENVDANKLERQESSSKSQWSADSTEGSCTDISESIENQKVKATPDDEPSSQSTIVLRDLDDNPIEEFNSNQIVSEKNSNLQQSFLTHLGLSKISNYEKIRTIRDELLEILSEENFKEDSNGVMREVGDILDASYSDTSDDEEKYSESKVAAALKELDEDSLSDFGIISDYDLDSSSIDDLLLYRNSDTEEIDKNQAVNFLPKKCSVILERRNLEKMQQELQSRPEMLASIEEITDDENSQSASKECPVYHSGTTSVDEDAEIDRLCRLPTFGRKRRFSEEKKNKRKIKRKRRSINLSGSETSDLSGYSSVSEDEVKKERIPEYNEEEDDNTPLDPNTLLMEIVCHTIHDSDSDSSATSSNEEHKQRTKRRKIDNIELKEEGTKVKKEKEDSWKDDPLLRVNLNVPSENDRKKKDVSKKTHDSLHGDVESHESNKTKAKNKRKYLFPDDSDSLSTDSSSDDFEDSFKRPKKTALEEDSDVEVVNSSTSNIINVDSEEEMDDKNQTRKKIKSVLSRKNLTEETQRAAEEETARIRKLEEQKQMRCSQESQSTQDNGLVLDVCSDGTSITVDPNLTKKLFPHQIDGVKFMWESCYLSVDSLKTFQGTGCILAHNMGLGKTFQVVTLVHTLFSHSFTNTKHVLIVCPLSTVSGWKREFQNALKIAQKTKDIKIIMIKSKDDRSTKCYLLNTWRREGGVMIIGYDFFSRIIKDDDSNLSKEIRNALVNPGPDLVICDEAHVLKNGKSMRTKALMEIKTKRRIALTGTPLQNNLKEYYFMVQFVKPNLLGNKQEFNRQFVNPIMNGQYEDSLEHDITLMKKRTHVLHRLLKNTVQRYEPTELQKYLQSMHDYAIFIQLHPLQEKLYKAYMEKKKSIEKEKNIKTFFIDYQILKYICSHPQLLHTMETQNTQRNRNVLQEKEIISQEPEVIEFEGVPQDWWKIHCSDDIKTNLELGTKLQVMMAIIEEAEKIGEKVLIFTSSLVELSSVEYFLKLIGTPQCSSWKPKRDYFRMDGTVPPSIRTEMCDMFNDEKNKTLRVFLMSHKVGGLGLNLTAANRVILLGANFNPSLDSQSIYRTYRFGQNKMVYIYRLLSMGTMEEKIYNRCVTKLAIASRVVDKHQITRHYKNLDLEDLYNIEIDLSLKRPTPAKPDDDILSTILLKFECVHKFHHHQKLLENRPDEDLNEEDQRKAWEEFEDMIQREKNALNSAASKIPELIENQWNQLHPFRPPMLPMPLGRQTQSFGNLTTQGTTSTVSQPTDASTSQARTATVPLGTFNNMTCIPRRSDAGNRLNVHSTNGAGDQTQGISTNSSVEDRTTDAAVSQTSTGVHPNSTPISRNPLHLNVHSAKDVAGHKTDGATNQLQGIFMNSSLVDRTTGGAIGQTRTGAPPSSTAIPISRTPWHLNAHSAKTAAAHTTGGSSSHSKIGTGGQTNGVTTISDDARKALLNATAQILQNVSNASQADKSKQPKKKSSAIGPNPLVLARLQHRKENLAGNSTKAPWRTSSSDDFQRPSGSNISTSKKKKPKVSHVPPESSSDNEVICIDISDEATSSVQKQLDELRKRNLTVIKTTTQKNNNNPPIIDIT